MEAMNARAKLAGQQEISRICIALAKLMRATQSKIQYHHSWKKKFPICKNYLEIQQFIMGDRLDAFLELCDGLGSRPIPALRCSRSSKMPSCMAWKGQEGCRDFHFRVL